MTGLAEACFSAQSWWITGGLARLDVCRPRESHSGRAPPPWARESRPVARGSSGGQTGVLQGFLGTHISALAALGRRCSRPLGLAMCGRDSRGFVWASIHAWTPDIVLGVRCTQRSGGRKEPLKPLFCWANAAAGTSLPPCPRVSGVLPAQNP
jgi:hypothetical protein